jgi:hypothetical protein
MKKELPAWVVFGAFAIAIAIALILFYFSDPAKRVKVIHVGPNEVFDLKTGKAVPAGTPTGSPQGQ